MALGVTDEVVLTLPRSNVSIDTQIKVDEPLVAPLDVNDVVGQVTLLRGGEVVSEVPLRVLQRVEPAGFFVRLWDSIVLWFQQLLG